MKPAPFIRPALDDELDEITELDRQFFAHNCPLTKEEIETWDWWVAVAELDDVDRIVGYAASTASHNWTDAVYLARAGVRADYRGRGLQRRFVRVRESWARRQGMIWSVTDTSYNNIASTTSLIKCGYLPFIPSNPWRASGTTYWRRRIA